MQMNLFAIRITKTSSTFIRGIIYDPTFLFYRFVKRLICLSLSLFFLRIFIIAEIKMNTKRRKDTYVRAKSVDEAHNMRKIYAGNRMFVTQDNTPANALLSEEREFPFLRQDNTQSEDQPSFEASLAIPIQLFPVSQAVHTLPTTRTKSLLSLNQEKLTSLLSMPAIYIYMFQNIPSGSVSLSDNERGPWINARS